MTWANEVPVSGGPRIPCHNDLAPRNTVFRGGAAVGLLDWDLVAIGPRIWDLAHAAWQFVPLIGDASAAELGWSAPPYRGRRLRLLADEYGLEEAGRRELLPMVSRRMRATSDGIDALADRGQPAFVRLRERGFTRSIRADADWVDEQDNLAGALL
ncbi:phosphotransferase [Nonomuraea longicatena]|uniref:Aminoglycoside phosphotransferase domain-containing protein n=1 Tax=Nonomuraea longicatena TaxID=83682 RepID=A0ABN1Q8U4_9ACTN